MSGTLVEWGGMVATAGPVSYTRTNGLEPDVAIVEFHESQFREWAAELDPARFAPVKAGPLSDLVRLIEQDLPRVLPEALDRVPYRADLTLAQRTPAQAGRGEWSREVVVPCMFLADVMVRERLRRGALVQLGLVDIRRWWEHYGEVTRNFNVRLADGALDLSSADPDNPGDPAPLRRIFEVLLRALPGSPEVSDWPEGLEVERTLRLWGASPKETLRGLLADYQLTLSLRLDGTVGIYRVGEGEVGEATEIGPLFYDPEKREGAWADRLIEDRYWRREPVDQADEVLVVGAPKVYTCAVDYWDPVLVQEPDNQTGRGLVVVEASLENLQRYARGVDVFADDPDLPDEDAPEIDVAALAQLPLVAGADLEAMAEVNGVPLTRLKGLQRQLFRYYRIPAAYRRLLPMLRRAERWADGSRQAAVAEAYSFQQVRRDVSASELLGEDPVAAEQAAKRERYDALVERSAALEQEIRRIRKLTSADVVATLTALYDATIGDGRDDSGPFQLTPPTVSEDGEVGFAFSSPLISFNAGAGGVDADVDVERMASSMWAFGRQWIAETVGLDGVEPNAVADALQAQKDALDKQAAELYREINPQKALEIEIHRQGKALEASEGASGVRNEGLRAQITQLREQLFDLIQNGAEEKEAAKPTTVLLHANLPRQRVPFRVVDADQGIIEILGPLPGWLADPFVEKAHETQFVPLPVRVIFGTTNSAPRRRPVTQPGLMAGWGTGLGGQVQATAEVGALFANCGHVLPALEGGERSAWAWTRAQVEGQGPEDDAPPPGTPGPHPYRVVDQDLQVLVTLDGLSNEAEERAKAYELAKPFLQGDRTLDSGYVIVHGPRPVDTNGRVTSVVIEPTPQGAGLMTRVGFDSEVEPLPGAFTQPNLSAPRRTIYGLDARALARG